MLTHKHTYILTKRLIDTCSLTDLLIQRQRDITQNIYTNTQKHANTQKYTHEYIVIQRRINTWADRHINTLTAHNKLTYHQPNTLKDKHIVN